jgi:hypothetical protein
MVADVGSGHRMGYTAYDMLLRVHVYLHTLDGAGLWAMGQNPSLTDGFYAGVLRTF